MPARRAPDTYALLRAALAPYLTAPRVTAAALLFVVLPLVSLVLRVRRRRAHALGDGARTAADVRRRLEAAGGARAGLAGRVWGEVVRAVGDTVRMSGRGLV